MWLERQTKISQVGWFQLSKVEQELWTSKHIGTPDLRDSVYLFTVTAAADSASADGYGIKLEVNSEKQTGEDG